MKNETTLMDEKTPYHKYVSFPQILPDSLYTVGLEKTGHTDPKNEYGGPKGQE